MDNLIDAAGTFSGLNTSCGVISIIGHAVTQLTVAFILVVAQITVAKDAREGYR
jgi:hypothetical protein